MEARLSSSQPVREAAACGRATQLRLDGRPQCVHRRRLAVHEIRRAGAAPRSRRAIAGFRRGRRAPTSSPCFSMRAFTGTTCPRIFTSGRPLDELPAPGLGGLVADEDHRVPAARQGGRQVMQHAATGRHAARRDHNRRRARLSTSSADCWNRRHGLRRRAGWPRAGGVVAQSVQGHRAVHEDRNGAECAPRPPACCTPVPAPLPRGHRERRDDHLPAAAPPSR